MSAKYETTNNQHPIDARLFQIRALRDIPSIGVKAGDLGGYIENKGNLSQEGDCWVGIDARIYGNAHVCDNAQVYDTAWVSGDARVSGSAYVAGDAWVKGDVILNENMEVTGIARIISMAQIYYADGVTAYFDTNQELTVHGATTDIEHHKTLAKLKL